MAGAVVAQAWDGQLRAAARDHGPGRDGHGTTVLPAWLGGPVFDESSTVTVQVSGSWPPAPGKPCCSMNPSTPCCWAARSCASGRRRCCLWALICCLVCCAVSAARSGPWVAMWPASAVCCWATACGRVGSQTNEIGLQRQIKAVTLGQFLSSGTAEGLHRYRCGAQAVQPGQSPGAAGRSDLAVTWQRRARRSYQYSGPAPVVPLGEAVEAYRVRVFAGSTLLRSDVVSKQLPLHRRHAGRRWPGQVPPCSLKSARSPRPWGLAIHLP
jgi:hypothetical protein